MDLLFPSATLTSLPHIHLVTKAALAPAIVYWQIVLSFEAVCLEFRQCKEVIQSTILNFPMTFLISLSVAFFYPGNRVNDNWMV